MGFNLYSLWILFLSIATFVRINISTKSRLLNCPTTYAYITLRASQFHPHTTAAIRKVWDEAGHWKIGIDTGEASPRWSLLMRGKRSAEWCWSCAGWITQPSWMVAVSCSIAEAEVYQKESECRKNLFTASSASPEARVFLRRFYAFLGCVFFFICFSQFPRSRSTVWGFDYHSLYSLCNLCRHMMSGAIYFSNYFDSLLSTHWFPRGCFNHNA